jgi:hypothetical protein
MFVHDRFDMNKRFKNLNIFFWSLWIFYRYDNFEYIAQLIVLFVINNIIYDDICRFDEYLNVLRQIDHEFLWLCLISIDFNLIFITFSWRIMCFQLSRISSIIFRRRISFYSELQLEFLHTSNLFDWLFWLDRIKTILNVLSYHSILVRFVNLLFRLIKLFNACVYFDYLSRYFRQIYSQNDELTSSLYYSFFLIDKLSWNRIQLKIQFI